MRTSSEHKLSEIAEYISATLEGDGDIVITDVAPVEKATESQISFVESKKLYKYIDSTKASALIVPPEAPSGGKPVLRHPQPKLAFARVLDLFYPDIPLVTEGIHSSAVIEDDSLIDSSSRIGPLCHIRSGSTIRKNTQLVSSIYIGRNVEIGEDCLIYPGVMILDDCKIGNNVIIHSSTVIGSDGFGYAPSEKGLMKIKQVGWVEIGDDVEIGSNVSIDRGALGATVVARGTKIDNLVQIGHNNEIGEHCVLCGQVGLAGSSKIGNRVTLAGQVGLSDHCLIGNDVQVGAKSGVKGKLVDGKAYFGYPARELSQAARIEATLRRLPELFRKIVELEKKLSKKSGE